MLPQNWADEFIRDWTPQVVTEVGGGRLAVVLAELAHSPAHSPRPLRISGRQRQLRRCHGRHVRLGVWERHNLVTAPVYHLQVIKGFARVCRFFAVDCILSCRLTDNYLFWARRGQLTGARVKWATQYPDGTRVTSTLDVDGTIAFPGSTAASAADGAFALSSVRPIFLIGGQC